MVDIARIPENWPKLGAFGAILWLSLVQTSISQISPVKQSPIVAEEQDYAFAVGLYKDGVYQLAEEQFARFVVRYPASVKRVDASFLQNACCYYQGKYDSAIKGFTQFIADFPHSGLVSEAYFRSGDSYLKLKKPTQGINAYKTVLDKFSDAELAGESAYWIGEAHVQLDEFDNAIKYYTLAYENYPQNRLRDCALYSIGWTYQRKSEYPKAADWYARFLKEFPQSSLTASAKVRIGECYYYAKDYRRSIEVLTQSRSTIQQSDERGQADYLIAEAFYQLADYPEAQKRYDTFLKEYANHSLQREVIYALGWTYLKENNFADAARTFDKNTNINDDLGNASLYRKSVAEKLAGNRQKASVSLEDLIKRDPKGEYTDNALYDRGVIKYEDRNAVEAKRDFQQILELFPSSDVFADACRMMGECLAAKSDFKGAQEWFTKAATNPKASFDVKLNSSYQEALSFYKMNMLKEASTEFAEFIKTFPKHPKADEARFWLAETEYRLGNFDLALMDYRLVLTSSAKSKREDAMYGIGWSHFKKNEFSQAIDAFEQLIVAYPSGTKSFDARLRIGDAYFQLKDYRRAGGSYRTVIRLFPKNDGVDYAYYQLGQTLFRDGDYTGAYQQFTALISAFPASNLADDSQYALGWIDFQRKDFIEAIKEFQKLVATYPNSDLVPRALYSTGDSYYNLQKYAEAVNEYRDLVSRYPKSSYVSDAMNGIQYCLVAQGKQKEAAEETDNYVKANPTSGIGEDLLLKHGDLLYAQKDFSGAEREYRRFVQQYPNSKNLAMAYYWTAKSLQAQDKVDDAVATYESAVGTTNSNPKIVALSLYELSVLYSSLKKYDKAFAALSRIEKEFKDSEIASDASYAKGILFLENDNLTEAKNQFDALIAQFPSSEVADKGRIGLVRVHIAEKDYTSAQRMAQSIATARVDEIGAEAQYLTGVAYADAKDWSGTVTAFLRVKYVFPAYEQWLAKAYLGLGSAYEATKEIRLAKDAYQSAIRFKRETETVGEAQKRLKELEKF